MPIIDNKIQEPITDVQDLSPEPPEGTAPIIQAAFDAGAERIRQKLNALIDDLLKVTDGNSGADNIAATEITDLSGNTVQALLESLRDKLKSTVDSSSGADFVKATEIEGLSGTTIQALLESLKQYIDSLGSNQNQALTTHKSSGDHDGRYYTETEVNELLNLYTTISEITNNRKLDGNGNFTGSWFGISEPTLADPGIANVVAGHTAQLAEIVQVKLPAKSNKTYVDTNISKQEKLNYITRCNLALLGENTTLFSSGNIVDGKVKEWYDQSIRGQRAYQNTVSSQPSFANAPILKDAIVLPDVEFGVVDKGFTCTGLAYDENEDIFYVGNIGKALPATPGFKSTIVKLSKDGTENLGEIKLYETFPAMSDVQGVTIDKSDNTIWFCSFAENKIRHITKVGADLGSFNITSPTGIAYDSRTNSLWILTNDVLKNVNKSGVQIKSIALALTAQDQLFLDEPNDTMYVTAGANYTGSNYVHKVNLTTDSNSLVYTLTDSFAIEGIYIEYGTMYILNDGYYHSGTVAINQMNIYNINSKGITFDAVDDALVVDANANINDITRVSFVCVVKFNGEGGLNAGRLFDKINGTNGFNLALIGLDLAYAEYRVDGINGWNAIDSNIEYGKVIHVVLTMDKSSTSNIPKLYINGVSQVLTKVGTFTGAFTSDATSPLYIGNNSSGGRALNGTMFEFCIVNKELTQEEITKLYSIAKDEYGIS